MKNFIRKTAIATALILTVATAAFKAKAQDNRLVYKSAHNSTIGITVDNATGTGYSIKDQKGNIILKGTIKNNKIFFIPISKLGKGVYQFMIGSLVLQEFEIR